MFQKFLPINLLVLTCGVLAISGQVTSNPPHGADMPNRGAWNIRAVAFSVGRLTVTRDSREEIFVKDDLHKKAARIAEGFGPDWSPNGSRIVFAAIGDRGGKSEIYTVNLDGSAKRQLTQEKGGTGACMPAWSPDGK